jgi:hypothetical protein
MPNKMNNKILFLIPAMMILMLAAVSAASVTISMFYDSTSSSSLSITNGDSFGMSVSADSIFEDSMSIKVDLLKSSGSLVANILDVDTTEDSYSKHLTVGQAAYLAPGNYILKGKVTGASGQSKTVNLCFTVHAQTPVNHAPVITSSPVTQVNEGQSYVYQSTATDADGDVLDYSLTQNPPWIAIDASGRIYGTAPQVDSDTSFDITLRVSDATSYALQSFTITVKNVCVPPVNHAPVITSTPATQINERQDYTYQIIASDADGDVLTYSLIQYPPWISIDTDGTITGTAPHVDYDIPYTIKICVSDGKTCATQNYVITVKNVEEIPNHAPVITSTPVIQVNEGENYVYQSAANDADGDVLDYSLTQNPPWISIDADGTITGTAPHVDSDTSFDITLRVSDATSYALQSYTIIVKNICVPPVNHAPLILSAAVTEVDEREDYSYQLVVSDEDGDVLTYSIEQGPFWLSISNSGLVSGTAPSVSSDKQYSVILKVSDGKAYSTESYTITVKDTDSDDDDDDEGDNNGANYISDEDGTNQYLGQFTPKTITEEEEVLNASEEISAWRNLWLWLLIAIIMLIAIAIFYWMRK